VGQSDRAVLRRRGEPGEDQREERHANLLLGGQLVSPYASNLDLDFYSSVTF
jgi:hypothetical protein